MAPLTTQPRVQVSPFAFSGIAAVAGAQLSVFYLDQESTYQESPMRKPRIYDQQYSSPMKKRWASPAPSFDPADRHPLSYVRPSNWKGLEHSKALLGIWVTLTQAGMPLHIPDKSNENEAGNKRDASNGTKNFAEVEQKLRIAEDGMRLSFPVLGQGEVSLSTKWLGHVFGREGVKPFSGKKWKEDAGL